MSKYKIVGVQLSKQTVQPGEKLTVKVDVATWDWVQKTQLTWATLKNKFAKWGDLFGD